MKGGAGQGKGVETFFFGWCVGFLMRYRFTFSRLENWVNVLRLSPPATDTQRGLRSPSFFFRSWVDFIWKTTRKVRGV